MAVTEYSIVILCSKNRQFTSAKDKSRLQHADRIILESLSKMSLFIKKLELNPGVNECLKNPMFFN